MIIYIVAGLIVIGLVAFLLWWQKPSSILDSHFISTESQSRERVRDLDLDRSSEDASYILDSTKLVFPNSNEDADNAEWKANPDKDWVLELSAVNGEEFTQKDISQLFDHDWRSRFQSMIYGCSTKESKWTLAIAGDAPESFNKLQVAIDVQDVYGVEYPIYEPMELERYCTELENRIRKYPTKLRLERNETIESAIQKAKNLVSLHRDFSYDAIVVLKGNARYDGIKAWDALQSVGLEWGDGDLLHWVNKRRDYGHDKHFDVWTTSEPGYFLPEVVKDGKMNPQDLVFGFSVPRSADPINVYDVMFNAAVYCQKRLGGQLLDKHMKHLNVETAREEIKAIMGRMEGRGMKAGSMRALRMF